MFVIGLLSWWYGAGWRLRAVRLREHVVAMVDYFSIDLLARTLFAPFRQISAGNVRGSLGVQIRAFFDRLVSRCIGAAVRLVMIVVGTLAIMVSAVVGGLVLIVWAVVPLLPVFGVVLSLTGWVPWSL